MPPTPSTGTISFQYFLQPNQVYVGSTNTLTFSFLNASGQTASAVKVTLQFPISLVSAANAANINPTAITPGWTATRVQSSSGWVFVVTPTIGTTTLPAGGSVQVTLANVQIGAQAGPGDVLVAEVSSLGTGTTSVPMLAEAQPLTIQASANPTVVGLGESTEITWAATGGSQVVISGVGDPIVIPLSGSGPVYTGKTQVTPDQTSPQTTFQVCVQTADHQSSCVNVVVGLSRPVVDTFSLAPAGPYGTPDGATLTWAVRYAEQVQLVANGSVVQALGASGSMPFVPGKYLIGNQSSYTLSLRAFGFQGWIEIDQPIAFDPAAILWLRYTDATMKYVTYQAANGSPSLAIAGLDYTLTVTGPGGPLVQTLGPDSPAPQVQLFGATPNPAPSGGPVTLSWTTANCTALRLDPGAIQVPANQIASGTQVVTPSATTVYVLTASQGATQITSQLTVTVGS